MDDFSVVIQVIEEWAWIGWLVLIALFLVIEMLTLDFTFLMLSFGATIGLLSGLIGLPVWLQVIIAAIAAALFVMLLRPPLLRRLRRGEDPTKSNVDALIDLRGTALDPVTEVSGQVRLSNGDTWTARTTGSTPIPEGTRIAVSEVNGATVLVRPITETE